MADLNFLTFSESEASNHIKICLDYFFDHDGKNRYKFSDAYLKYTKIGDDSLVSTRRYFNIVRSTNLVSDELVFRQQTTSGFQYLIQKRYFNLATRYGRRISRQSSRQPTPVSITTHAVEETKDASPTNTDSTTSFTKVSNSNLGPNNNDQQETPTIVPTPSGNESIESLSIGDTWASTPRPVTATNQFDTQISATNTPTSVEHPVKQRLLKEVSPTNNNITDRMKESIPTSFKFVRSPSTTDEDMDFQGITRRFVTTEIERILQEKHPSLLNLEGRIERMDKLCNDVLMARNKFEVVEEQYKKGSEKVHSRLHWLHTKMEEYETKFHRKYNDALDETINNARSTIQTTTDESIKFISDKMSAINTQFAVASSDVEKLTKTVNDHAMNIAKMDDNILPSARSLKAITTKAKNSVL